MTSASTILERQEENNLLKPPRILSGRGITIPATVFACEASPLKALVTYLQTHAGLELTTIAEQLGRSYRTVWGAKGEKDKPLKRTHYHIPLEAYGMRDFSILETTVLYLKTAYRLSFSAIAELVEKNPSTVWTAWSRAREKLTTVPS